MHTGGSREIASASGGMSWMLQALRARGADQGIDRDQVPRRDGPRGLEGAPPAGDPPDHDHPGNRLAPTLLGVGPFAVVGFAVLTVTLLAATLGHVVEPPSLVGCRARGTRQIVAQC